MSRDKITLHNGDEFHGFTYLGPTAEISLCSNKKALFRCGCGREKLIRIEYVSLGKSKTCGLCEMRPSEWWAAQRFGGLRILRPEGLHLSANKKREFVCDCGRTAMIKVAHVTSGVQRSCGRCGVKPPEWWAARKFGKLKLTTPESLHVSSSKKRDFTCDCGNVKLACAHLVTSGQVCTCGECNIRPSEWWGAQKFGRLRMLYPRRMKIWSKKFAEFACDCGNTVALKVCHVTSGNTSSCGRCRESVDDWIRTNWKRIRGLRCPVLIEDFPAGGPIPLETIRTTKHCFRAICPICSSEYRPRFEFIKRGISLTCGCASGIVSSQNREIAEFVTSLGFEVSTEFRLDGKSFDVCVPDARLLIEFHGLYWHSREGSRRRDRDKYDLAVRSGYGLVSIFEDEWRDKRGIIEDILRARVGARRVAG